MNEHEKIKELNLKLQKAEEKAEESDRLKSSFLANMSHEIRIPMNGILGFTELLKEHDLTGSDREKYIDIIEKSGTRLLSIINDIIDLSKIESNQIETLVSNINISKQIAGLLDFFTIEAESKGIKLFFNKSEEILTYSDPVKLNCILTNLIKNAIKFTDSGSIEVGYALSEEYIKFYVKDSGCGIEKKKCKIIFDRFRQLENSCTRNYKGAGLGLAISKGYVEILGGKIWVESELGIGSIFYFTLPLVGLENNL